MSHDAFVDDETPYYSDEEWSGEPIAVLARFPNLSGSESDAADGEACVSRRLLGQALSFRLLAGTMILLIVAAVLPSVMGKKGSPSAGSTASDAPPAWQPEMPAPNADAAPRWNPPAAVAKVEKAVEPPASAANTAIAIGTADYNSSAMAIDGVRNAVTACVARANSAARVDNAGGFPPAEEALPLTWESFNRQHGTQTATAPANTSAALNVPQVEEPLPSYPTTNSPELLTIGSPIPAVSGRAPSAYSHRK